MTCMTINEWIIHEITRGEMLQEVIDLLKQEKRSIRFKYEHTDTFEKKEIF